jgi:hypothetical protein
VKPKPHKPAAKKEEAVKTKASEIIVPYDGPFVRFGPRPRLLERGFPLFGSGIDFQYLGCTADSEFVVLRAVEAIGIPKLIERL